MEDDYTETYPGMVEVCGYDMDKILANWDQPYRVKIIGPWERKKA